MQLSLEYFNECMIALVVSSAFQAQERWSVSNVNMGGLFCDGCVDCTRRIVGSCAELSAKRLHLTHVVCLMSTYEDTMSCIDVSVLSIT